MQGTDRSSAYRAVIGLLTAVLRMTATETLQYAYVGYDLLAQHTHTHTHTHTHRIRITIN